MKLFIKALLIILPLSLLQCQNMKSLEQISDKEKLIRYERTPCFGFCPVYTVTILKDGSAYFIGKQFVPVIDTIAFTLPDKVFRQISAITKHPDFRKMTIEIPDEQIMDIPGLNFVDYVNDQQYELDMVIPDPVSAIADRVDAVLHEKKLLYDNNIYPMVRQEIILALKPGTDPYTLDGKYKKYELSYQKKIGANIHLYEIITAEEYLQKAMNILRHQKDVQEVQLNHEIQRRD